jgi:tripartite-type tricarboxylate transporter receptor subunit TctC
MHGRGWLPACILALSALSAPAVHAAEAYPAKPVRLVVPWPPGGVVDIAARLLGPGLSEKIGQPVIIDNQAGASGVIGTERVAKTRADGYTLILFSSHTSNVSLVRKTPYDWTRDLAPVAAIGFATNLLVTHPSLPVRTVKDLVALARANAGKVAVASSGEGSASHLAAELFKSLAKVDMLHVPYKGAAPAIVDVLGGQVFVFFPPLPVGLPHVKAGKVTGLGVTSAKRSPLLPEVPAIAETVAGYEADQWLGVWGPAGLPADIVDRVARAVRDVLSSPRARDDYAQRGLAVAPGGPEDVRAAALADQGRMEKVVKAAGIAARD